MEKIRFIHDLSIEPLPCGYFDMICGTSTGGYTPIIKEYLALRFVVLSPLCSGDFACLLLNVSLPTLL